MGALSKPMEEDIILDHEFWLDKTVWNRARFVLQTGVNNLRFINLTEQTIANQLVSIKQGCNYIVSVVE